jgi:hypothetical protein
MSVHEAWSLVCRLFAGGSPVLRLALCPYCQLQNGQIFSDGHGGQFCQCADCGPIALMADERTAVMLDEQWLRSRLRMLRTGIDEPIGWRHVAPTVPWANFKFA